MLLNDRLSYRPGRYANLAAGSRSRAVAFEQAIGPLQEQSCAICGASDFDVFSEVDRYGFEYPTGICRACGNVQQAQYYSKVEIELLYREYYRDIYGAQSPAELFDDQLATGRHILRFVEDAGIARPRTALEIGTAAGGIISAFASAGTSVQGLDFDDRYMAFGRSKGLDIREGDVGSLEPDVTFDLIIMNHVLEHITDLRSLLRSIAAHLSPGGHFFIGVPTLEGVERNYGGNFLSYFQNAHFTHFHDKSIDNLLRVSGFEVVRTTGALDLLTRYTGRQGELTNDYAYAMRLIEQIEHRYQLERRRPARIARRLAGTVIDALGVGKAYRKRRQRSRAMIDA